MFALTMDMYRVKRNLFELKIEEFPKFKKYMATGYLKRDDEWALAKRPLEAHGNMTNNLCERWVLNSNNFTYF